MLNTGAVFLDRDGVIIEDVHYLSDVGQVSLIPGAAQAVANLNVAGIPVVIVTNQAGVARGYFPENRVSEVHGYLNELLAHHGAWIDAYYYCPHHPEGPVENYRIVCECRKPKAGMLRRAAMELGLDLTCSYLVGDKSSDLAAGGAAGCKTVLVRTGYGRQVNTFAGPKGWNLLRVAVDLNEAVRHLLPELIQACLKKSA
jgi:D-glycero-D-manno-heptose 1,7-bisphosphate phosphatase